MKRFLLRVAGFLIGVLVLLGIAEYLARTCPNAYSLKEQWMEQHKAKVETLVLGSSHTYAGIAPECLQGTAYNLANSNQPQRYDWLLLARDTTALTSLKAILYPTSSFLMDYPLEETPEWYRCIYYQRYNHCPVHSTWSKYAWEVASIQTCCWKVQSRMDSGHADRMCDDLGQCTYYQASPSNLGNLTDPKLKDRMEKYTSREKVRTEKEQYFPLIADYCQRHAIRLILIGMPVSHLYAESTKGRFYLTEMEEAARHYCSQYPCIEYHDYSFDKRFSDQDFFDVDHLNSEGSKKFTTLLSTDFSL